MLGRQRPSERGSTEILATFGNGLFVSTNAGNTFTSAALPSGPSGAWDRLAVDHAHSQPDIAYAFGAVGNVPYLWSRNGGTWKKITSLPTIDPNNPLDWTGLVRLVRKSDSKYS